MCSSEMAALAVAQARQLRLSEIVGFTATTNRASRRVLEKIGMRLERTLMRAGVLHVLGRVRTML